MMRARAALASGLLAVAPWGCVSPAVPEAPLSGLWVWRSDAGPVLSVDVGADGSVSGFAGCNRFSGHAAVEGGGLRFSGLSSTRMFCAEPGVMRVEQEFLEALALALLSVDGDGSLVVVSRSGVMVMGRAGPSAQVPSRGVV